MVAEIIHFQFSRIFWISPNKMSKIPKIFSGCNHICLFFASVVTAHSKVLWIKWCFSIVYKSFLSVTKPENLCSDDLVVWFSPETDKNEAYQRNQVDHEGRPVAQAEGHAQRAAQHDVNAARTEDSSDHHHHLKFMTTLQTWDILIIWHYKHIKISSGWII